MSSSPSVLATQTAQTVSPVTFTAVRLISSIRSTPTTRAIPSRGMPIWFKTMVSVIMPMPGTPAAPIDARVAVRTTVSRSVRPRSIPKTWAMKTVLTPW